jgi:hypothetical protein
MQPYNCRSGEGQKGSFHDAVKRRGQPLPLQRTDSGTEGKPLLAAWKGAAAYVLKLPKAEQKSPRLQTAGEALLMAAEDLHITVLPR